jgi:D-alanine-D-alanine ligase
MKIQIGVFFGGKSVEHEISVISALQTIAAIDKNKYEIVPVYISKSGEFYAGDQLLEVNNYKNINNLLRLCTKVRFSSNYGDSNLYNAQKGIFDKQIVTKIDVAFPVLHGTNGEDGTIQGLFELIGLPYVGCNVLGSAIGMDKIIMKMVLRESGIAIVDYVWFYSKDWLKNKAEISAKINKLGFPVIVKPANLGSSVGISKAANEDELEDAISLASCFSKRIVIEQMVVNLREINCSVLGDYEYAETSVCEEPVKQGDFLTYQDKYVNNSKGGGSKGMTSTKRIIPAPISDEMTKAIQEYALQTFRVLGSAGVSRIDFMIDDKTQNIYVNEINTIPGSLSFYLWEATNKTFQELVSKLIDLALKAHREKNNLTLTYDSNIFDLKSGSKIGGTKNGFK